MKSAPRTDKTKPYRPPRLVVYGTLRQLTMTAKGGKKSDGGGNPKTKAGTE